MATASSPSTSINPTDNATLNWIIGWGIIATGAFLLSRTKAGYAAIYYMLLLVIILLLLTQSRFILAEVNTALTESAPDSGPGTSGTGGPCTGQGYCWMPDWTLGKCVNGKCTPDTNVATNVYNTSMMPGGIITL